MRYLHQMWVFCCYSWDYVKFLSLIFLKKDVAFCLSWNVDLFLHPFPFTTTPPSLCPSFFIKVATSLFFFFLLSLFLLPGRISFSFVIIVGNQYGDQRAQRDGFSNAGQLDGDTCDQSKIHSSRWQALIVDGSESIVFHTLVCCVLFRIYDNQVESLWIEL